MIKNGFLITSLTLSMISLANANGVEPACQSHFVTASAEIIKKARTDSIAPGIVESSQLVCVNGTIDEGEPELTESHDTLLNPQLPDTLLATR